MDLLESIWLWMKLHWIYSLSGFVASLVYGVYAVTIWLRLSDKELQKGTRSANRSAWKEPWREIYRHPRYLHEAWFNFFGSAIGWACGGYLWKRLESNTFGTLEAGLSLTAALGMTGYLPVTLAGIASSFRALARRIKPR